MPVMETLIAHLKSKSVSLILDNCEHLVEACAQCAEALLRACAQVQSLATSREALGVRGETLFLVPPLSLPAPLAQGPSRL
jgi:non-specific serine/threonine protein kinase